MHGRVRLRVQYKACESKSVGSCRRLGFCRYVHNVGCALGGSSQPAECDWDGVELDGVDHSSVACDCSCDDIHSVLVHVDNTDG
jgi:hypothetical protein